jgi:hypothetical protein
MSFENQNSSNINSDYAQQICPQLLEEIANDDELKTLTDEEIKAVFGGRRLIKPMYGVVIKPPIFPSPWVRPMYGLSMPRFFK